MVEVRNRHFHSFAILSDFANCNTGCHSDSTSFAQSFSELVIVSLRDENLQPLNREKNWKKSRFTLISFTVNLHGHFPSYLKF